jgi:cytochrome c biogenesis protein CcdA/thiol-disulfide isomerase/thioredoxin
MLLLILFAFLAGAGTALSPCVLPVLPALLSTVGVGGRRRPVGVVLGLSVTFTATIVGIAKVVDGVGVGANLLRDLAVAVLLAAGVALLAPRFGDRLEAAISRLAVLGPRTRGEGFLSGLLVGGALGFLYTPCAGPILAAVISVSAASGRSVAVAIAYALGSAAVLFALLLGGKLIFDRIRGAGRGPLLARTLGVVMLITAIAITLRLDVNFDQYVAQHIPEVNLTASLERSGAVRARLPEITGRSSKFAAASAQLPSTANSTQANLLAIAHHLPNLGGAPEFVDTEKWFNTPGSQPLTLASLRGRVVLIDFWTYTCINCIRTLPYLKAWNRAYRPDGLTIVGVHTPEFSFERDSGNVANAISQFGLRYPVVQDNEMGTWNAYGNQYWPADYLIDRSGNVRYTSFGEGDYQRVESVIRALLAEAGRKPGATSKPTGVITPSQQTTPETYLGTARAEGWIDPPLPGPHLYPPAPAKLALGQFAYSGRWKISEQPATAISDAGIDVEFQAKHVYLVMSSANSRPRALTVLLDNRPVSRRLAGQDVHGASVTVTRQRLYTLISLPRAERHRLSLRLAPGVSGYAFTFG